LDNAKTTEELKYPFIRDVIGNGPKGNQTWLKYPYRAIKRRQDEKD